MINLKKLLPSYLIAASMISTAAMADWAVDSEQSKVFFISTKNLNTSEVHSFNRVEGKLSSDGKFTASIDLSTVETGIDIRNQRMREMLFKVDAFPQAKISATLAENIMALAKGETLHTELPATLTLMGIEKSLNLNVVVTKTTEGQFVVTSAKPVLLSAADLGLQAGVEALQKIAGLSSIGLSVPVTFNLVLN
ncbi:YceI family protein [Flavobacterium sp. W21_SRS_FM6]|uniref:YceI family protein n=1 Tax=Flavobacterium sp. W21_SRS_FM6 TaxID=3240268 RepID=UPI003F93BFBF